MTLSNPIGRLPHRRSGARSRSGPVVALTIALAGAVAAGAAIQTALPPAAFPPAVAGTLFALAAAVAAVAWLQPSPRQHFDYWDAAGLLTFLGILVAAAVEPAQMVEIVGGPGQP